MWRLSVAALAGFLILAGAYAGVTDDAIEARLRRDITFLASDECEGRGPGTKGIDKAAAYIAAKFEKAGLKPGGPGGSYFQPFTVSGDAKLGKPNYLRLRGPLGQEIELRAGVDFQVMGLSGTGKVSAPLVFAGYGIKAAKPDYDDFKGIDVAGKIVIVIRKTPRYVNKDAPAGDLRDNHATLDRKQAVPQTHKAAAVLLVNDRAEEGDKLMAFGDIAGLGSPNGIPALQVRRAVVDPILQSSLGKDLKEIEVAIDRDLKPRSAPLPGWTADLETHVTRAAIPVKNVIGMVEGSGPLADETVVIGAHYDHLGYGGRNSLAKNKGKKEIHHGADDNGSGTTTIMELARRFAQMSPRPGRRLVFIAFSAEEMGLLGSKHYCNKQPLFPLADTVAMVNLDMVGRLSQDPKTKKDKLLVEGIGTAKEFAQLIDKLNSSSGFQLIKKQGGTGPSDHDSFYRKKIPVVFIWTGQHKDYHRPSDTADKINVPGMRRVAGLAEKVIDHLATEKSRPEYVYVKSTLPSSGSSGKIPRLGIMPNYEEEKEGVLVGGVSDDGPAAKAGIKTGDQIVELAGKRVSNLQVYMVLMGEQRRGQAIEIGIVRDGKKMTLKVVPQ
jgi:hypothetical protein